MTFIDGSRITPGTEKCMCDTACPNCAGSGCGDCRGTGSRQCEFPCWQRLGMTTTPCCQDCAPLPGAREERWDAPGCQMCGAAPDEPCDCFDPQGDAA